MNNETSSNSNMDSQILLNQLILDYMKDQRRKRRWRRVIQLLVLGLLLYTGFKLFFFPDTELSINSKPHVGLIDISGEIGSNKEANADDLTQGMGRAYKNSNLKALILRINSPGGSPVQAEYIYSAIQYFRKKHPEIKVYAVCTDLCTSAAYYIAAAADEIYASPASLVGSIGVLYNGFGFVDLLNKIGVTRRLQTSGDYKGFLDPFSPSTDFQQQKLQVILNIIHQRFINRVKEGRGDRLHVTAETFSGLFWSGEQAVEMGLIDGLASSGQLAREKMHLDELVDYTYKQNFWDKMSRNIGTSLANELPASLGIKPGLS